MKRMTMGALGLLVMMCVSLSVSAQTTRIEAESYKTMSGVQLETTADSTGGQDVGWIDNGDWAEYSITAPVDGSYTLNFRVANQYGDGASITILSGSAVLGSVAVPRTGGWQVWKTFSVKVNLTKGTQTIRTAFVGGNFNFNYFDLIAPISVATPTPTPPTTTTVVTDSTTKARLDSLTQLVTTLQSQITALQANATAIPTLVFKAEYVKGSGTDADPYYFVIPTLIK